MARQSVTVTFTARTETIGERLIVRLPPDASSALPSRGQVAAQVTVGALTASVVVEPDGRRGHWLSLDGDLAAAAAAADAGNGVAIELRTVTQWPEPAVPKDLAGALDGAPDLASTWAGLTPMARWEWVRWIGATKNPATRARRVAVTIDKLRKGSRRPCCFDLSSCTDPELATSGKLAAPTA